MMRFSCPGLPGCVPVPQRAMSGADLDLGGDELSDDVALELSSLRGPEKLLETVHETVRLGIEDGELLLDRDREIGRRLELLAGETDLLLRAQALLFSHQSRESS